MHPNSQEALPMNNASVISFFISLSKAKFALTSAPHPFKENEAEAYSASAYDSTVSTIFLLILTLDFNVYVIKSFSYTKGLPTLKPYPCGKSILNP